jgi:HSP20 family protein
MFDFPNWNDPFDELGRMRRQMDALVNSLAGGRRSVTKAGVFPLLNLTENGEAYFVRAELPGVQAESLDIQATSGSLGLTGERTIATENAEVKYHRREREAGRFNRILNLPGEVSADKVEAQLQNGILTIKLPKAETQKPKKINVS